MAKDSSFDVVSQVDIQEVDNAFGQAKKEIAQRYDLKDSGASISLDKANKTLTVSAPSDFVAKQVIDIISSKLIKRGIDLGAVNWGKVEAASGGTVKQTASIVDGIDKETASKINKDIKATKLKVKVTIEGDKLRVSEMCIRDSSIPDAVGVFYRSPAGNVLHMGDFKLDQSPIDGVQTDFAALARFAKEGVDLMLSDSTNATNPNFTPSEAEVGKALDRIISGAKGRVIVASFASHIHRMQQICDAAVKNGRKVAVTGRSMVQNTDIARRLGYLNISDKDIIDAYDLKGMPPDSYVVMCTGSQGEPLSALARIAGGNHKTCLLYTSRCV